MMKVFKCSMGGNKEVLFEGTQEQCIAFYKFWDGSYMDENDFVWDLAIE